MYQRSSLLVLHLELNYFKLVMQQHQTVQNLTIHDCTVMYLSNVSLFDFFTIGNCAVIKPSEVACATAELLTELIPKYLDQVVY